MNLILLDPFGQDIPQLIVSTLVSHLLPSCITFNPNGQRLAAGSLSGEVLIWDMDTLCVSMELQGKINN